MATRKQTKKAAKSASKKKASTSNASARTTARKKVAKKVAKKAARKSSDATRPAASKKKASAKATTRSSRVKRDSSRDSRPTVTMPRPSSSLTRSSISSLPSKERRRPVLVIAGEHSGDLLGADVVQALQAEGFQNFFGTGGESMEAAGVELHETVDSMTVIGFVEAIKNYRRLKSLANRLLDVAVERDTGLAILVDYPGFNLRFAAMLHDAGIPVVFVVSPQLWGWHYSRMKMVQRSVDLMLPLFPFEEDMYRSEGVRAVCIGHPLIHRIPRRLRREEFLPPAPSQTRYTIGLLPGSRRSEVNRLIRPMLGAADILNKDTKGLRFLVPIAADNVREMIHEAVAEHPELPVEVVERSSLRVMDTSDIIAIASGTATLEAAYFKRPMVLVYRLGWINFIISMLLLRPRFIGIVNLLARRQVHVELLQTEVTAENIARALRHLKEDRQHREGMIQELEFVRRQLGRGNPAQKAAREIVRLLEERLQTS